MNQNMKARGLARVTEYLGSVTFEVIEQFASIKLFQLECIFRSFKFLPRTFPLTAGSEDFVDLSDNEIF